MWLEWTTWSDCPVTCGTGQLTRERGCLNDTSLCLMYSNEGELAEETLDCNTKPCSRNFFTLNVFLACHDENNKDKTPDLFFISFWVYRVNATISQKWNRKQTIPEKIEVKKWILLFLWEICFRSPSPVGTKKKEKNF